MSNTTIKSTILFLQLQEQLQEEWSRFYNKDCDLSKFKEMLIDYPSNSLVELYKQIPTENEEEWYELIDEEIDEIIDYTNNYMR